MTTHPDILGPDYFARTLDLRDGSVATLVHRTADSGVERRGAILYVHGFVDYFFQDHVASWFTARGWDFFALDLRRNGRSLRPNGGIPFSTSDIREYGEELDLAVAQIRADGHPRLIGLVHSTGGLIVPRWLIDRKDRPLDGLILNSPWLDLQDNWFNRTIVTWLVRLIRRIRPEAVIPQKMEGIYARSVHQSAYGEWDFNIDWKPLSAQPVRVGFLGSVRREQASLHKGWPLGIPVLMLRSTKSLLGQDTYTDAARCADTVLNVEQMERWLPALGADTVDVPLENAVHDVFLSSEPVRTKAFEHLERWLARIAPR